MESPTEAEKLKLHNRIRLQKNKTTPKKKQNKTFTYVKDSEKKGRKGTNQLRPPKIVQHANHQWFIFIPLSTKNKNNNNIFFKKTDIYGIYIRTYFQLKGIIT